MAAALVRSAKSCYGMSHMGQIICGNCGHRPHPGVPFCVEILSDVGLPCECLEFVPVEQGESGEKSLFDLAKEFTEQSGHTFTAMYESRDVPAGRSPGWLKELMAQHGQAVDIDDILEHRTQPNGVIVLFAPLSGDVVVYEMSRWFSDRLNRIFASQGQLTNQ